MTCTRCDGLMMLERYQDILDEAGEINFNAWHCLSCGEVVDQVIVSNRRNQTKPLHNRNRRLMAYN
jgi:hypothetical protein